MEQSVSKLFTEYMSRIMIAESTVIIKNRAFRWFIEMFDDMAIDEVRFAHAEKYRNMLVGRAGKPGTVNTYLRSIDPFFDWAMKEGHIRTNPFHSIKSLPGEQFMLRPFKPAELERIMRVADERWRAMVLLAACCSLRRSEILNLTVADINIAEEQVWVTPKKATRETWLWRIKNHRQAIVGLPDTIRFTNIQINLQMLLIKIIEELRGQPYLFVKPHYYKRLMRFRDEGLLTWEKRNCPWGNFDRDFKSLLRRANVEKRRFHDLRGTYATQMIKNGCQLKEVQRLMRHSSINTTAKYYIYVDDEKLVAQSARIAEKCYAT